MLTSRQKNKSTACCLTSTQSCLGGDSSECASVLPDINAPPRLVSCLHASWLLSLSARLCPAAQRHMLAAPEGGRLLAGPVLLHQVSAASVPTPWVCAHHAWRVTPSLETRHFTNAHCAATCYRNTVLPGASCLGFLLMLKPGESPLGWNTRAAALTAVLPPAAGTHC